MRGGGARGDIFALYGRGPFAPSRILADPFQRWRPVLLQRPSGRRVGAKFRRNSRIQTSRLFRRVSGVVRDLHANEPVGEGGRSRSSVNVLWFSPIRMEGETRPRCQSAVRVNVVMVGPLGHGEAVSVH